MSVKDYSKSRACNIYKISSLNSHDTSNTGLRFSKLSWSWSTSPSSSSGPTLAADGWWLLLDWNWKITIRAPIMVLLMVFHHYAECLIDSGQNKVRKISWQVFKQACCPIWKPDWRAVKQNKESGKSRGWSVGNYELDLMVHHDLILRKRQGLQTHQHASLE